MDRGHRRRGRRVHVQHDAQAARGGGARRLGAGPGRARRSSCPARDVQALQGATIDWEGDALQGGLKLVNPNRPAPASPAITPNADVELTGPLAQRVRDVVEHQVNPAIASHGGRAELVAVEEPIAYVRLHGGCQGCGMASVTLHQGIEVAIRDNVPEIQQVVDVTDHASGENPYFEAAKK